VATPTVFFVVLDGLADDPIPDLGDRTPLEAASTPNLDRLAAEGKLGTSTTVGEGIAPESDIAVMALLGYDPYEHHPGRGIVEALGAGVNVVDGDLAWRGNFATVDEWPHLADRRAGRDLPPEEAERLAGLISEQVDLPGADFVLHPTVGHRAVLRIRHHRHGLGASITNTDPAYRREGTLGVALESHPEEIQTARAVDETDEASALGAELTNRFTRRSYEVLREAPLNRSRRAEGRMAANVLLCRDAGNRVSELTPIGDRYGARFGCFVEMPVEAGIARMTGMEPIAADRSEDPETRYRAWAELAGKRASDHDVLYLHLKGPDIPAHDGDWAAKRDIIETIDRAFFGSFRPGGDDLVLVTADHATSSVRAAHTDDPVPVLVWGPVESDATERFSESQARRGDLGHLPGTRLMDAALGFVRA